jgi:hypothetical protein
MIQLVRPGDLTILPLDDRLGYAPLVARADLQPEPDVGEASGMRLRSAHSCRLVSGYA